MKARRPRGARGDRIDGDVLYQLRIKKKLTQADLAARAGITHGHISRLEAGQRAWPATEITDKLAAALDVDVRDLLAPVPVGASR